MFYAYLKENFEKYNISLCGGVMGSGLTPVCQSVPHRE